MAVSELNYMQFAAEKYLSLWFHAFWFVCIFWLSHDNVETIWKMPQNGQAMLSAFKRYTQHNTVGCSNAIHALNIPSTV